MHCTACRHENPEANRFCGRCGAALTPTELGPGDRRQLTIMFCDIVGSTELSNVLDPEELSEAVSGFQQLCTREISGLEGRVAQLLGDGLLAYFGHPQAHDDDPVRAVQAALAILSRMPPLNESLGKRIARMRTNPLGVRLAIHTGPVVMSEGISGRGERLALGRPANVAARLESLADVDSVVVSGATRRRLGKLFELEDLGPKPLRGMPAPVHVYRVLRAHRSQDPLDRVHPGESLTPLVGRDQELALLLERWQRVREASDAGPSHGQVVLVRGEAGMGKSRLVYELRRRIESEADTWLEGRCATHLQSSAFRPVIEIVEQALGLAFQDPPAERLAKLAAGLRAAGERGDVPEHALPMLQTLLALPGEAKLPLSLEARRRLTIETLLAWPLRAAARGPLVLVLEDVQWADPSTLQLLGRLLEAMPSARVLLLLTARPEFDLPIPSRPGIVQLALPPLTREQVTAVATSIAGGRQLPERVLRQIVERTDGVPLFVEELTRTLLESGLLEATAADRYELRGASQALEIPATLQDSLTARLDALGPGKPIVQAAAAIGREFSSELLAAAVPIDPALLEPTLQELVRAGILRRSEASSRAPLAFTHALIRETAYLSMLRGPRQQVHARVAQALEQRFPEMLEAHPETLARHWEEAGDAARAAGHYAHAGERSAIRSESAEAVLHARRGLELLSRLEPGAERDRLELRLQIALGTPLATTLGQGHPEVERTYLRALHLAQRSDGGNGTDSFRAFWGLSRFFQGRGQLEIAAELNDLLLDRAERKGDEALLAWAYLGRGLTSFWRGEPRRSVEQLERALELSSPGARALAHVLGQDLETTSRSFVAVAWWVVGRPHQALVRSREAVGDETGNPDALSRAYALDYAAVLHCLRGERALAEDHAAEAASVASRHEIPLWLAFARVMQAWAHGMARPGRPAIEELEQRLAELSQTGTALGAPFLLALLAELQQAAGCLPEALATVERAAATSSAQQSPFWDAELSRRKGEILLETLHRAPSPPGARDTAHRAEQCLRRAVAVAHQQEARSLELRAALSLGRCLLERGDQVAARSHLGETLDDFLKDCDDSDVRDVHEARALLARLA